MQVLSLSAMVFAAAWVMAPQISSLWTVASLSPAEVAATENSVHYTRCAEARAAGVAPIYRGQPGYREGLDGDYDGVACEPSR